MKKGKVIIVNPQLLDQQKIKMRKMGADNLQVIADFDRTITKCFVDGKRTSSLIGVLRDKNFLSSEYVNKSKALFNKYHPIEINNKLPLNIKKKKMLEWWKKHFALLISSGLTKELVKFAMDEADTHLRPGGQKFFRRLAKRNIPLIIFSAGGLGQESIRIFLRKRALFFDNVYIVANYFVWDKQGNLAGIEKPIIHVFNKDEAILKNFPFYNQVKKRKNVILVGDSLGDAKMATGMPHDEVIKIGFLNENNRSHIEDYCQVFDVVIIGDASFYFVNQLLKDILKL